MIVPKSIGEMFKNFACGGVTMGVLKRFFSLHTETG
jgi:hypothetical protein